MAQDEDSLVILGLAIFFGLLILQGVRLLARHIDQQNYERRRFYLSVAADLDRLDKIVAEGNRPKEESIPSNNWAGRN